MNRAEAGLVYLAVVAITGAAARGDGFQVEKRFQLDSGATLSLKSEVGDVDVHGVDGAQAVVSVRSDRDDFEKTFDVRIEQPRSNRLEVTILRHVRGILHWSGGFRSHTHIEVSLPRSAAAELDSSGGGIEVAALDGKVKADSSGGSVHVADLGGDTVLSSSGGAVVAERVHGALRADSSGGGVHATAIGGACHLESSGGAIEGEEIAGDVDASSSGGGVRIREAHGVVVADSSGGPVKVSFAAGNAKGGSLDSSGGGVEALVDPAVGLEIDASSSGGSVHAEIPITVQGKISSDAVRGKLNAGGALLKLRSSGGGITLGER